MTREQNIALVTWVFAEKLKRANVCPVCEWRLEHNVPWYHHCEPPDFFTSESANALLLEKMPLGRVFRNTRNGPWICESDWRFFHNAAEHDDRKTCVVLAALKLIAEEEGK